MFLRAMAVGVVLALVLPAGPAAGASTKDRLVATWVAVKGNIPKGSTVVFTRDGKVTITAKIGDTPRTAEGTYQAGGNRIKIIQKVAGQKITYTLTIKSLTNRELVTEDKDGKMDTYRRK
jgi:uncharacterized protein (TIGR03066 family)